MKVGRNDPCTCGSGLKFKKCCLNETAPGTAPRKAEIPVEEFNRRIAYEGKVGKERMEWCESFISWKKEQLEKVSAAQKKFEEVSGTPISCSEGCDYCCRQFIGASLQECEGIVYWLYQHEEVYQKFMARYDRWREGVGDLEDIAQAGTACFRDLRNDSARELFLERSDRYGQRNIPCPFLDNRRCLIYPVRPFVCATHVVVSPPDDCKWTTEEKSVQVAKGPSMDPESQPTYFRGSRSAIWAPMPQMVYQILIGGFMCLNDMPGLAGLEREAFDDPIIKAKIASWN